MAALTDFTDEKKAQLREQLESIVESAKESIEILTAPQSDVDPDECFALDNCRSELIDGNIREIIGATKKIDEILGFPIGVVEPV
jgi:hypothetical protein